jgi:hypothetical protein
MINLHSQGFTGCKDMPAQQFFIFSQLTLLQNCRAVYGRAAAALSLLQHAGSGGVQMPAQSPSATSH